MIDKCQVCNKRAVTYIHLWMFCKEHFKEHVRDRNDKGCRLCVEHLGYKPLIRKKNSRKII